jgi:hypothetical protein
LIGVFAKIKDKFSEIGGNIVAGIKAGIKNAWANLKEWFTGLFGDLIGIAKKILGIESPSKEFAYIGKMTMAGVEVGWEKDFPNVEKQISDDLKHMTGEVQATVNAENARYGFSHGAPDTGFTELARAVNVQTGGINSLASAQRGGSSRPVVLMLDKRELGSAVVDVGSAETVRVGTKLITGGAR